MAKSEDRGVKRLDIGSHRTCSAEETFERVYPKGSRFGVTRIANVTGLDRIGIPVTLAIRPDARSVAVSQGKGIALADARASGLMEAIELWHAENPILDLRYGTVDRLQETLPLVDTEALPRLDGKTRNGSEPILWTPGADLATDELVYVPFEMVHADYCAPGYPGHGHFPASTNGLASGNHPLEARCHALYEVIERDAVSLFFAGGDEDRVAWRVDLSTIDGVRSTLLMERIVDADLLLAVWDVTSDIGIASFYVLIGGSAGDGHVGAGSGTHFDRDAALARALSEAAQTRMTYITGSRDDLAGDEFTEAGRAEKSDMVTRLAGSAAMPCSFQDVPDTIHETLREDLDAVLARLADVGLGTPVGVDLSRPESGIHVVRVVVPGLEAPHDDPGYVPGPRAGGAG